MMGIPSSLEDTITELYILLAFLDVYVHMGEQARGQLPAAPSRALWPCHCPPPAATQLSPS